MVAEANITLSLNRTIGQDNPLSVPALNYSYGSKVEVTVLCRSVYESHWRGNSFDVIPRNGTDINCNRNILYGGYAFVNIELCRFSAFEVHGHRA